MGGWPRARADARAEAIERRDGPSFEVRLLGGLTVLAGGVERAVPPGAASTTVCVLALRRAVHVEELTEILWPGVDPELGRRRLRNVLARVRQACGPLLQRHGERIELAGNTVVDHHVLEDRARHALASRPGPTRLAALEALVLDDQGPLLPEGQYEPWIEPAQHRTIARRVDVLRALATARAAAGDLAGARAAIGSAADPVDA